MSQPFVPHSIENHEIAASDPGVGAPDTAPGFGIGTDETPPTDPEAPDGVGAGEDTTPTDEDDTDGPGASPVDAPRPS